MTGPAKPYLDAEFLEGRRPLLKVQPPEPWPPAPGEAAEPAVRFCKDCRYFDRLTFAMCCHVSAARASGEVGLVTGMARCVEARRGDGACGPDARLFERSVREGVDFEVVRRRPWWRFWQVFWRLFEGAGAPR
jgi:hypothetical protein